MEWLKKNVLENHGPLGKLYPSKTWTTPNPHGAIKEGDTPSWFFFLENGLNIPEQPELGGWGGRFLKNESGVYRDTTDTFEGKTEARATVYRWRHDFQDDWAARMDWCVKNYDECNHAPVAAVNGSKDKKPLVISAKKGDDIILDASQSFDPDNNEINFEWLVYPELSGQDKAAIQKTEREKAYLEINNIQSSGSLSLLLRVTDNGNPQLVGYKRILINSKK